MTETPIEERRAMIARLIEHREGRAPTDDPDDRGGPTRFGITERALADWNRLEPDRLIQEIAEVDEACAFEIYDRVFLRHYKIAAISDPLIRESFFDAAVNQGIKAASRMLQSAMNDAGLHVKIDGWVGPVTLATLNAAHRARLARVADAFVNRRRRRYDALIAGNPSQAKFRNGWYRRAEKFRAINFLRSSL